METTEKIITRLAKQLNRVPTEDEIGVEQIRLRKAWYASMMATDMMLRDEAEEASGNRGDR
jgi:hypothetical protein